MFDKTLLPPALFEFAVISDTHYMRDVGDQPLEFESRRKQTARAETALRQIAGLDAAFVVHLGDLAQEYPESPVFPQAIDEARQQLKTCGVAPHHVPGNHDVGDKCDPTMPTHPATSKSLAFYHAQFGPSWYGFNRENCHFVVLNSQILNGDMPETDAQWQWLARDLETHAGQRIFIFLHLPPYLFDANEPGLGHYDNINPPDRHRLLGLVQKYNVERLFAGHVHFAFYDRIGAARYAILQSPSFTRPGFGHLFSSAPPPERGRDDAPKLGVYLMRVLPDRTDVHLIRTGGATESPKHTRLVTCLSAGLPHSPLGVTLRHPLTPTGEVPLAWPSTVRQPVRNDYPYLSLLELGATTVRIPARDLSDPFQRNRLLMLRDDGIKLTATMLEPGLEALSDQMAAHTDLVDTWEIQIPGAILPPPEMVNALKNRPPESSVALCPILPNERVPGKQHLRTRMGYRPDELAELNDALENQGITIDRALCRISPDETLWDCIQSLPSAFDRISHIDFAIACTSENDAENASRLAIALFAMAQRPHSRLYVDPFIDLDRTMDAAHGLLDTLCNPRIAFNVLRSLNTLVFGPLQNGRFQSPASKTGPNFRAYGFEDSATWLIVPTAQTALPADLLPDVDPIKLYHLAPGEVEIRPASATFPFRAPVLLTRA